VLVFSIALTAATGLLIGLVPALRQSRVDPQSTLAEAGRGVGATPLRQRFRRALVIAEVTLAVVVLVASGLLLRSFLAMTRVPLGFDASDTVTAQLTLPRASYDTPDKIVGFHRALVDQLLARPGVVAASAVYPLPSSAEDWSGSLFIEGQAVPDGQPEPHSAMAVALPNYFTTLRIPLIEGRDFAPTDMIGAPRVAIVDEMLARRHWPGQSAVGKRLSPFGQPKNTDGWTTIVGIVAHVHTAGPRNDSEPLVYLPQLQQAQSSLFFVMRRTTDRVSLPSDMRASVRAIDPALAISRLAYLDDLNRQTTAPDRFNVLLLTIFAIVALAIAAVGLYGVMAYLVSQRQREIGIRLALGGRPASVLASIVTEGLTLTAAGLALGLAAAVALSRLLADMVFEVRPTDPLTYAAIAAILLVVAFAASLVPARRAMRVDPVSVLRE
jgi:predicted permease